MSANILPLPQIVARVAEIVGCGNDVAAAFIREFATTVSQGLAADGVVTIDGLGTFHATADVEGNPAVEFAPAEKFAETVNEPFAFFESVELSDAITDEALSQPAVPTAADAPVDDEATAADAPKDEEPSSEDAPVEEPSAPEIPEEPQIFPPPIPQPKPAPGRRKPEPQPAQQPEPQPVQQPAQQPIVPQPLQVSCDGPLDLHYDTPVPVRLDPETSVSITSERHSGLTVLFAALAAGFFGILLGALLFWWLFTPSANNRQAENVIESETVAALVDSTSVSSDSVVAPVPADSVTTASEAPATEIPATAPAVITDTVAPGNFLTVMSRHHYGKPDFWVYIYLENKDKIADPDNLANGLVLVIPPREKYGIDPANPESVKKARQEAWKATMQ